MKEGNGHVRQVLVLHGLVQGVGFRPRILNLAQRFGVTGIVQNLSGVLLIEAEGRKPAVTEFLQQVIASAPSIAEIHRTQTRAIPPRNERSFRILESASGPMTGWGILPDLAHCAECLQESADSSSRRLGYPFTTCTQCGPRFSIIRAAPFDRERTSMAAFPMCDQCAAEYSNPLNRRFHAQTIACPLCGPCIRLLNACGVLLQTEDPLENAIERVRAGEIGALKGVGGYHLFCDALNEEAVANLRRRKGRDVKPFAIMVRDLATLESLAIVSPIEEQHLASPARPIVLLEAFPGNRLAPSLAPGLTSLGVMLPCSLVHHLLMERAGSMPLVMTSGNPTQQPTISHDQKAIDDLGGIADFFLVHDREIQNASDDSVMRFGGSHRIFIRRSRGYAPAPFRFPAVGSENLLALGGQLKSTFALATGGQVVVSHHLGDLDQIAVYKEFEAAIQKYEQLFEVTPTTLVHDSHPDYMSTRYALERASRDQLQIFAVQHHHAHMASCMAEHHLDGPVIGVIFDGTGYGTDGTIWGGEFLVGDFKSFDRAAHLRNIAMPGGERAIREPWRMAVAYLLDAGLLPEEFIRDVEPRAISMVKQMIAKGISTPLTTSCGRFLDAIACLISGKLRASYDGQPAIELEALASKGKGTDSYLYGLSPEQPFVVDLRPVVRGVVSDLATGLEKNEIARKVHLTLSEVVHGVCRQIRARTAVNQVVLSGGVFMNALLLQGTRNRLDSGGFAVFSQEQVPPNDAGLCLGQLAVASARN